MSELLQPKGQPKSIDPRAKNLRKDRQWKPGQSGNPKGGSKKQHFAKTFHEWVEKTCPESPAEVFQVLSEGAKRGRDFRFVAEYLDRYQGKTPNKTEMTGKDGEPMKFNITVVAPEAAARLNELRKKLAGE